MTDITMPRLSDSMEEGTILSWLKRPGERVVRGDELVEIETDKATMTYESPEEGALEIVAQVGETLPVGAVIARLGAGGSANGAAARAADGHDCVAASELVTQPTVADADAAPAPVVTAPPPPDDEPVRATPLARRMAAAHGVDLKSLDASGPGGRVLRADVQRAAQLPVGPLAARGGESAASSTDSAHGLPTATSVAASPADATGAKGHSTIVEPTRLQQVIARRMAEAKATIPEFQVQTEVVMDAGLAMRKQLKELHGPAAPSINDLVVKAAALALRRHPRANGSYRDGRFELYSVVNVGVAVAARDALVVPVVTDADIRSLGDIAAEVRRLAERVRSGEVTPPELSGGTFTISNLGMYGMTAITPVINPPQAGILGVGALRAVPGIEDGRLVEEQRMTLTLSCDHRILYGADAAEFLSTIRELLERPLGLVQ